MKENSKIIKPYGEPNVLLEWFFEALEKRVAAGVKLDDLFLITPSENEAEFDYELASAFKWDNIFGLKGHGNILRRDYPTLARLIENSDKKITVKVFFIKPERCPKIILLNKRRYNYPKVSVPRNARSMRSILN